LSTQQLTLNFEAGYSETYPSCREFVQARVHQQGRPQKAIAADMDYSPSDLSRKLAQGPDDSRRFTLDDLERFIEVTGDVTPVYFLIEKFLIGSGKDEQIAELERQLSVLRGGK
jgi:hypothetical protein